ncbi:unnamed protein product [Litomosoides sigmodontis]|uniref:Cytochrome b-c1 complex subunit 10 n=1 Tax=Litomosoides sigmodontis TaxID=42156 RepID=A0A3P6SPR3_LITSI|nr:unnamed protein product [Litomosoides sigmodontis]
MDYVNYKRFFRNALRNKAYLPTYGAFGVGSVLALIYISNWEAVGRRIPIWKYHFEPIPVEKTNSTNAT